MRLFFLCLAAMVISCSNSPQREKQDSSESSTTLIQDSIKSNVMTEQENVTAYDYEIVDNWLKIDLDQSAVIDSLGKPDLKGNDDY